MRTRQLNRLLVLNGALLALLAVVTFAPSVSAQSRIRGDYSMVAGNVKNAQAAVLYIVDGINQELVAILWDNNTRQLAGLSYRDLNGDAGTLRNSRN